MGERMEEASLREEAYRVALEYLRNQDYQIIETNYPSLRGGVDIIAQDQETLVFIEVIARQGGRFGEVLDKKDWAKQNRTKKIAYKYIRAKGAWQRKYRFDLIGVIFNNKQEVKAIELIRDAY